MRRTPDPGFSNRLAWIPLILLVCVGLIGTVALSWTAVVDLLGQGVDLVSIDDPEEARYAFSPWLRPYFETADEVRPLARDHTVVVNGRHRYFVAYRLMPNEVLLDEPRVVHRLQERGVEFLKVGPQDSRSPSGAVANHVDGELVFRDFEAGHVDDWSVSSEKGVGDSR